MCHLLTHLEGPAMVLVPRWVLACAGGLASGLGGTVINRTRRVLEFFEKVRPNPLAKDV